MLSFKGLYLKDLKISRNNFFIGMILLLFVTVASYGLKEYMGEPSIPVIFLFVALALHVFYLPGILFTSLQVEGQSQLWLHNPNGGAKLFLSKLAAATTYFVISLLVMFILLKLAISGLGITTNLIEIAEMMEGNLHLFIGAIGLTAFYLSIWLLFYWSLYHSLKGIPFLSRIRWLVILVVWIVINMISNFFAELKVFEVMNEKGSIQVNFSSPYFNNFTEEIGHVNLFAIGLQILIIICVFIVSVWLLERKVEV
ncbi:hypothetical protein [Robertmurraya massiliosenegalensis]|uniref:hypothetical protein n=1 Tax=Robertmurraya massiliosenegalensis TaxID=1287657 RepID=UPI0003155A08|nr:hypothetical protein [Robertmurraya massiliosenegalensis]